ncbi:hypothetical protein [Paenibacillus sp. FSL E2-0178]|uniref:hypothetical protein n=1 Tax=Paenibacillus sp. FSL E2-0178 TaxID=2921361 RepID=UPI0031596C87
MKLIKQLLLKIGIIKNTYKTSEQIHNEKINKINNELLYVKDNLIKLLPEELQKEFFVERVRIVSNKEVSKMLLRLNNVGFSKRETEMLENNQLEHFGS